MMQSKCFGVGSSNKYLFVDINGKSEVDVLSLVDLQPIAAIKLDSKSMYCSLVHKNKLFIGDSGNQLLMYNLQNFQLEKKLKLSGSIYCIVAFKSYILCGGNDGRVELINPVTFTSLQSFRIKNFPKVTNMIDFKT